MKFNDQDLIRLSTRKADIEGRLQHRAPPGTFRESGFRERYFKLVDNMLFYFRINDFGAKEDEPLGVIVTENFLVNLEKSIAFAFTIHFLDEPDKRHVFTARTELDVQQWVKTLRVASSQYWKERFNLLTAMVNSMIDIKNRLNISTDSNSKPPSSAPSAITSSVQNTVNTRSIKNQNQSQKFGGGDQVASEEDLIKF